MRKHSTGPEELPEQTSIGDQGDLVKVAPKSLDGYDDVSLVALTVYALFWLEQWEIRPTIEAIAVLNWRLFPEKFAMVGFPQFPDAFRTNRSLMQGQPKYRNWLTGNARHGYALNERGLDLASELVERLGARATGAGTVLDSVKDVRRVSAQAKKPRTVEPERELARVRDTTLYKKWKSDELTENDVVHLYAMLRIFDHTPVSVRRKRMQELEKAATEKDDQEIAAFLKTVWRTFRRLYLSQSR